MEQPDERLLRLELKVDHIERSLAEIRQEEKAARSALLERIKEIAFVVERMNATLIDRIIQDKIEHTNILQALSDHIIQDQKHMNAILVTILGAVVTASAFVIWNIFWKGGTP